MRSSGVLEAASVEPGDHACWAFDGHGDFASAAAAFLVEGAARHERLIYVADADFETIRHDLEPLGDVDARLADGALVVHSAGDLYRPGGQFEAHQQVAAYTRLVDEALAWGFSGLRVAADATALASTDESRRSFLHYEVAIDRFMSTAPMTAMCAYDVGVLGPAVSDLAAVHPLRRGHPATGAPGFHAFHDWPVLRLAGEVDLASQEVFTVVLEAVEASGDDEVVIDLGDIEFLDVRGITRLWLLKQRLAHAGRSLRITEAPPIVGRSAALLGFDGLIPAGSRP